MKAAPDDIKGYWYERKSHDLYKLTVALGKAFFPTAQSIIDVGSYISPLILDFDWIPRKIATDINPAIIPNWQDVAGVDFINCDALTYDFGEPFDLVLSNQAIEHIEKPVQFIDKLLKVGKSLLISTTYELPFGMIKGHVQDPISLDKFKSWFPVELDAWSICYHPLRKIKHIIGIIKQSPYHP